jgi:DNA-binding response OmpR family regulator
VYVANDHQVVPFERPRARATGSAGDSTSVALTTSRRILVIEDHRNLAELVKLHLRELASEVRLAFDGHAGLAEAESGRYDLVILDLMLPGLDGLQICRRLRSRGNNVPILMLTAKAEESDRVIGLEAGADDYLTKPFGVAELVARVKALFRRHDSFRLPGGSQAAGTYTYGPLIIDEAKRRVTLSGNRVDLTVREFDLLLLLAANPGKTFTRAQLLDQVWGYNFAGGENTLKSHVNRLRNRIEEQPANPRYVMTVWGVGYRFADPEASAS